METNDSNDKNLDEFLNEFEFKAITDGLGFHHGQDSKEPQTIKERSQMLASEFEKQRAKHTSGRESLSNVNMGDLSPFYSEEAVSKPDVESILDLGSRERELETSYEAEAVSLVGDVSVLKRLFAFSLDICAVFILLTTYLTGIIFASNLSIERLLSVDSFYIIENLVVAFTLFYLFYFTVLDKTKNSTLGKRLLKIKVINLAAGSPSIIQTLGRSIISIMTLGLFNLLGYCESLTSTRVISKLSNE